MYTCLSRGTTLDGTIIVQSFDKKKLTGSISGSLRQEFRELEILDEITQMRYQGNISSQVMGITRNELIHSFRKWKGENFIPKGVHGALNWSNQSPFPIDPVEEDSSWQIISANTDSKSGPKKVPTNVFPQADRRAFIPPKGSQVVQALSEYTGTKKDKRKREPDEEDNMNITEPNMKVKHVQIQESGSDIVLHGFPGDDIDLSCTYDSLLTVLLSAYTDYPSPWTEHIQNCTTL